MLQHWYAASYSTFAELLLSLHFLRKTTGGITFVPLFIPLKRRSFPPGYITEEKILHLRTVSTAV
jgi:hypothetical protein